MEVRSVTTLPDYLDDKRLMQAQTYAKRMIKNLDLAGTWVPSGPGMTYVLAADTVAAIAPNLFRSAFQLATAQCLNVYERRIQEASHYRFKESYTALTRFGTEHVDVLEVISQSATILFQVWTEDTPQSQMEKVAAEIITQVSLNQEEIPFGLMGQPNYDVTRRTLDVDAFYTVGVEPLANHLIRHLQPESAPITSLRVWAGVKWLEDVVTSRHSGLYPGDHGYGTYAPSSLPVKTGDRSLRRFASWKLTDAKKAIFVDPNQDGFNVIYLDESLNSEGNLQRALDMRRGRTPDVFRLVIAKVIQEWHASDKAPYVWISVQELCGELGYREHVNGGYKPMHKFLVARALSDLMHLYVQCAPDTRDYTSNDQKFVSPEYRSLLEVKEKQGGTTFKGESLPDRWYVSLGDWIKEFPRNQFAPLFLSLVRIPGHDGYFQWTKDLGIELIWQYRQDKKAEKIQLVRTMLKQGGLLTQVLKASNRSRSRDYFEKAMDLLKQYGICTSWQYRKQDIDNVEAVPLNGPWFELWLETRVVITAPPEIASAMKQIARKQDRHIKAARRQSKKK